MLERKYTFMSSEPETVLFRVSEMSGVKPVLSGKGPYQLDVVVMPPFDETRFDNVANVIAGLATNVERLPDPTPAASGQENTK